MKSFVGYCLLLVSVSLVAGEEPQEDYDYRVRIVGPNLQNVSMVCTNDAQCQEKFKDSLCRFGKCFCRESPNSNKPSFPCSLENVDLTPKKFGVIGRVCKHDADCGFDNFYCNTTRFQCYCKPGFTEAAKGNKCLLVVKNINGTCEENIQCQITFHNSTCKDNQCSCQDGYYFNEKENQCLSTSVIGAACTDKTECYFGPYTHPETVDCINGHCNCTAGLHFYENMCAGADSLLHISAATIILLVTSLLICS